MNAVEKSTVPLYKRRWMHLLLLLIVASSVFINSAGNDFVWDDVDLIAENLTIRDPGNLGKVFSTHYWDVGTPKDRISGNYRPATVASFLLNYQLTGPSPAGFRVVNIALHALNTCLVYLLSTLLGLPAFCAVAAGLIFATHPVHVEPVVWITGRCELMACCGLLSALCCYLKSRQNKCLSFYLFSLLLFATALFSKESALAFVPIVVCCEMALHAERQEGLSTLLRRLWILAPFLIVACVFMVIRYMVVGAIADQGSDPGFFFQGNSPLDIFLTMVKVLAYYWVLLGFPLKLSAHYDQNDFPVPQSLLEPSFLTAVAAHLTVLVVIGFLVKRKKHIHAFAVVWVYLALLPYFHIIHFEWLLAERFLYNPSVGFAMALAAGLHAVVKRFDDKGKMLSVLLVAVVLLFSVRTVARNYDWRNEIAFFGDLVRQKPDLLGARVGYGNALLKAGRYQESVIEFKAAEELKRVGDK